MRKKDAIAFGYLTGEFHTEDSARAYCERKSLKVEFKSTSSKRDFLMKVSNSQGWISPKSWVNNYLAEMNRQYNELHSRLKDLGQFTDEPIRDYEIEDEDVEAPICVFSPNINQVDKITPELLAQYVINGLKETHPDTPVIVKGRRAGSEKTFASPKDVGVVNYFVAMLKGLAK